MMNYQKLDHLKQKLDSYLPLAPEIVSGLYKDLVLCWTYNSNAIEGNPDTCTIHFSFGFPFRETKGKMQNTVLL